MLDFSQFSGLVLFMFIFTAGFWLLIFLLTFVVPYFYLDLGDERLETAICVFLVNICRALLDWWDNLGKFEIEKRG